jgi:N-acetyl-anhydromuramyl-L-alanine amidase AmpD
VGFASVIQVAEAANGSFLVAMESAAQTRQAPLPLIEAIAYVNTRWEWIGTPSGDRGVGPMNILPSQIDQAATLSGHTRAQIGSELNANFDAGTALLAHFHTIGTDLASWQHALFSTQGAIVTGQIYDALRAGVTRTTSTGETITFSPQTLPNPALAVMSPAIALSSDYAPAAWVPASASNYSVANRPHDYTVDMIVIHDIEGSYGSAIQTFQNPARHASAHFIVSYKGLVTQMVREKDIAWHAGNWDYNTRAIGIEHEGFAWTPGLYTTAEYKASAAIAASICSRFGVPMDRAHVIGHNQVPDPNNPTLFGGADHHTDPGPYWNWTYYMSQAQADANALPSPPRMMPDPVAVNGLTSVTVTWEPARSCHAPISGYTVVGEPGNLTMNLPSTATSATFAGLQQETTYTFTVTAHNSYGDDSLNSNPATPGRCATVGVTTSPASPQRSGTPIQLTAGSTGCPNPRYEFWVLAPGTTTWQLGQAYSSSPTFDVNTIGKLAGIYHFSIWAQDSASPGNGSNSLGSWDGYGSAQFTVNPAYCSAITVAAAPPSTAALGTPVAITGSASGCPAPLYEFWMLAPGASTWALAQAYSANPTFNWPTTGKPQGAYVISVWARDASSGGIGGNVLGTWDKYATVQYKLNLITCSSVTAASSPANAAAAGTPVAITGTATDCPKPVYQFWILEPGSSTWHIIQAYSSNATLQWNTAGKAAGTYRFSLWARDLSSAGTAGNSLGRWDSYIALTYSLS